MSRAYRIRVSESLQRVIRASDHVSTQLEMLDILPREEMAALLAAELAARGFENGEDGLVRETDGVRIAVDAASGTVTVSSESTADVNLTKKSQTYIDEEVGREVREQTKQSLRQQARRELEEAAKRKEQELQREATDRLEAELHDLRGELNAAVNRVTAEALKQKAARIGQIKELTEDPASGSMTIVVEV